MNFPKNFLWGVSTASYQVEGAAFSDNKGPTSWDAFSQIPGKVFAGENGNVSVDQFHRYKKDVALMKELGVGAYRFSIAWSRIFPEAGVEAFTNGKINPKGFEYYRNLIDALLESHIKPVVTLYHWDLPLGLQKRGGWANRDIVYCFQEYAEKVFEALGDKVDMWMPHNEPWCSAILGYLAGVHAPGIKNAQKAYSAIHHIHLSHGLAVQSFRSSKAKKGKIGPALNLYYYHPYSHSKEDVLAADRALDRDFRMFLHPYFSKPYPSRHLKAVNITMPILDNDMNIIAEPIDFIGLNYYSESLAKFDAKKREQFSIVAPKVPRTGMDWPIVPAGIHRVMQQVIKEVGKIDLYIMENGSAWDDEVEENGIHDYGRICYLQDHLAVCAQSISEGIPLKGYFAWSFIDNFEWSWGYSKRFGLVYCDYHTLARIPKDSFYKYQHIIRGNKFI